MNLTALQHSAFLQSLGWAIANSLWQGVILWCIYLLVNIIHKNASSTFKTNSGTASLFLLFAWFIVTFCQKFYTLIDSTEQNVSGNSSFSLRVAGTSSFLSWHKIIDGILKTLPYLSVAYLLLLVILALRLVNSYRHIYFIKNHGLHKAGVEWRLFAEKVANHIGITKKITIWLSDHVDVPATIGFIKPVILIPLASMNQLSVAQLEAIILHELSHIKRNDYLLNLFISLIETVLFFNPFVVLLCKVIKKERENSCDDFVIQYQYDRHSYASALLSLEQSRIQNLRLALTATSGKKQLLHRIQRIMEENTKARGFNYGQKLMALILGTGIICSVAWLSPEKKEHAVPNSITVKNNVAKKVESAPKQNIIAHSINILKSNVPGKSKKPIPVANNNTALFENPDINPEDNDEDVTEDQPLPVKQGLNASAVVAPHINSNGFFLNVDKLKPFNSAQPVFKKNKQFLLQQNLVNNIRVMTDAPTKFDVEKLKIEMQHAGLSFNWKNLEEEIKENWDKIQWLTQDEDQQKNILEKIEKMAWQEVERTSEKKLMERVRNGRSDIRRDLVKLNKNIALAYDTLLASKLLDNNNNTTIYSYVDPTNNDYATYTPAVASVARKTNKNIKQAQQRFEYRYTIDTNSPCKEKKSRQRECPNKKLTIDYSNGTVFINGKKISPAELNDLPEMNLKSITIDPEKQHAEILIND
jgi:beta-lactamase regulating signal transducer with metallopeptidase domain